MSDLEQFLLPERNARLDDVLSKRSRSLILVLDRVMNAHNISAVMRSADAFGVQEIHLVGEASEFSPNISLGTERWLELKRHSSPTSAIEELQGRGYRFVILESPASPSVATAPPIPVFSLPFGENLALIFGNEHRGISEEFSRVADLKAYIPMLGFAESFNISVAAAITMFCSLLGKVEGRRQASPLEEEDRTRLKAEWVRGSLRHGDVILKEVETRKRFKNTSE